jgi:hypothetical protein
VIRTCQLAVALLAACCVGAAGAKPPADDIEQLTTTLPSLNPGQTAWVSTLWRGASDDATSFRMEADAPSGVTISYPENTPGYSSLYKDSTLLAQDTDYASLKVQVGDDPLGNQTIRLTVTYCFADRGKCNNSGNGGGHVKRKLDVTLPVAAFNGPAVEQVTTSVGPIKAGSAQFVSVAYKANKPGVTNARLTATAPEGATVIYPDEGTSSGFAADTTLSVGETDSASFKIDTGTLQPGSYTVRLDLAYGSGQHLPGTVTLTVN